MSGPRLRPAAAALLLLSAAALCAGQPKAAKPVVVSTTVTEDLAQRFVFPKGWDVPANLQQLIPSFMRGALTRIYRGAMPYADAVKVCTNLAAKKSVNLLATKKKLKETVQVLAATAPCSTGKGLTPTKAGLSPATFLVLVKKFNADLEKSFTVLRCVKGSAQCILYRLAPPCFGGICKVEPDPSLASTVFSDTNPPVVEVTNPDALQGALEQAQSDPTVLTNIAGTFLAYTGDQVDDQAVVDDVIDSVGDSLNRVVNRYQATGDLPAGGASSAALSDDEPQTQLGLTIFGADSAVFFTEQRMANIQPGVSDDEDTTTPPVNGSSSAAALTLAAVYGLSDEDFSNIGDKADLGPGMGPVRDQGTCGASWVHATLSQIEALLKQKYPNLPADQIKLSPQQVLDCLGITDCSNSADMSTAIDHIVANALHLERNYAYDSGEHGEVTECMTDIIDRILTTSDDGSGSAGASAAGLDPAAGGIPCPKPCKNPPQDPCKPKRTTRSKRLDRARERKRCLKTPAGRAFLKAKKANLACRQFNTDCVKQCPNNVCPGGVIPQPKTKSKKFRYRGKKGKNAKKVLKKLGKKKGKKRIFPKKPKSTRRLAQTDYIEIPERQAILKAVLSKGTPIQVTLSGNILQDYMGGVVNPKLCSTTYNHAAVLIGYNDKAWKLRNSMGTDHGENGEFWLAMAEDQDDGPCGLYFNIMYPDISPDEIELVEDNA